jgi:hypothetical protein
MKAPTNHVILDSVLCKQHLTYILLFQRLHWVSDEKLLKVHFLFGVLAPHCISSDVSFANDGISSQRVTPCRRKAYRKHLSEVVRGFSEQHQVTSLKHA